MDAPVVKREYCNWYSSHLQRDMEMLVFGHGGKPVILFPTRTARFFDYEDWGVMKAMNARMAAGEMQFYCVDSVDNDSFYNKELLPAERIKKHFLFEHYILKEVIPFIKSKNANPYLVSAGCSLGGFHALNIAMRFPHFFKKVIGMSSRYDLTLKLPYFDDLFDGVKNNDIFLSTPLHFVNNINSAQLLRQLRKLEVIIAIGKTDAFLENNILMCEALTNKGIPNMLEFWEGEAHKAQYWGQMLQRYL